MASFKINFVDAPEVAPTVTADYYQIEDGWVHFKDNSGLQVASFPAEGVIGIRRQPQEVSVTGHVAVSAVDVEAMARRVASKAAAGLPYA